MMMVVVHRTVELTTKDSANCVDASTYLRRQPAHVVGHRNFDVANDTSLATAEQRRDRIAAALAAKNMSRPEH